MEVEYPKAPDGTTGSRRKLGPQMHGALMYMYGQALMPANIVPSFESNI